MIDEYTYREQRGRYWRDLTGDIRVMLLAVAAIGTPIIDLAFHLWPHHGR